MFKVFTKKYFEHTFTKGRVFIISEGEKKLVINSLPTYPKIPQLKESVCFCLIFMTKQSLPDLSSSLQFRACITRKWGHKFSGDYQGENGMKSGISCHCLKQSSEPLLTMNPLATERWLNLFRFFFH